MKEPLFKSYPVNATADEVEWLGASLGSSLAFSFVCFVLLVMEKPNFAAEMWLACSWVAFLFWFLTTFVSGTIAIYLSLIVSEVICYFGHAVWWMYIVGPFAFLMMSVFAVLIGAICAVSLLFFYKTLFHGENKQPIVDYSTGIAQRVGLAIVIFWNADRMMPFWAISMFARYVSIGFLVCAFAAHDYSYFVVLRWVVFLTCVMTAVLCLKKLLHWGLIFGSVTFLFNPLDPIMMTRGVWTAIDWVTAFFLGYSIFLCPPLFGVELKKLLATSGRRELGVRYRLRLQELVAVYRG